MSFVPNGTVVDMTIVPYWTIIKKDMLLEKISKKRRKVLSLLSLNLC